MSEYDVRRESTLYLAGLGMRLCGGCSLPRSLARFFDEEAAVDDDDDDQLASIPTAWMVTVISLATIMSPETRTLITVLSMPSVLATTETGQNNLAMVPPQSESDFASTLLTMMVEAGLMLWLRMRLSLILRLRLRLMLRLWLRLRLRLRVIDRNVPANSCRQ